MTRLHAVLALLLAGALRSTSDGLVVAIPALTLDAAPGGLALRF